MGTQDSAKSALLSAARTAFARISCNKLPSVGYKQVFVLTSAANPRDNNLFLVLERKNRRAPLDANCQQHFPPAQESRNESFERSS